MIISKTTSYAIRILQAMARNEKEATTATILFRQLKIKENYLKRLMTTLAKQGFIKGKRGRSGGFILARPANQIFLSGVIEAVEGLESFNACILGVTDCRLSPVCAMHDVWGEIRKTMLNTSSSTTIQDLAKSPGNIQTEMSNK